MGEGILGTFWTTLQAFSKSKIISKFKKKILNDKTLYTFILDAIKIYNIKAYKIFMTLFSILHFTFQKNQWLISIISTLTDEIKRKVLNYDLYVSLFK